MHRVYLSTALSLVSAATLSFSPSPALSQSATPQQPVQPAQSAPAAQSAPPTQSAPANQAASANQSAPSVQSAPQAQTRIQPPISNAAAVEATDGRYVPASGTIDGSNMKQFLNSGPEINATQMEEASIPADNLMQMPASVNNKADYKAQKAAQAQANGAPGQQQNPHKTQKEKHHTFFNTLTQPFVSTLNFLGFPVGLNEDVGIDASLSSDLPESVRKRDGAYNPNVAPGVEATTNKYFGQ